MKTPSVKMTKAIYKIIIFNLHEFKHNFVKKKTNKKGDKNPNENNLSYSAHYSTQ